MDVRQLQAFIDCSETSKECFEPWSWAQVIPFAQRSRRALGTILRLNMWPDGTRRKTLGPLGILKKLVLLCHTAFTCGTVHVQLLPQKLKTAQNVEKFAQEQHTSYITVTPAQSPTLSVASAF